MDPSVQKNSKVAAIGVVVHRAQNIFDLRGDKVTAPTYVRLLLGGNHVSSDIAYSYVYNFDSKLKLRGDESHLIVEVVYAPGPFGVYKGTVGTCYLPTDFLSKCVATPFHGVLPLSDPLGAVDETHRMELVVTITAEARTTQMISEFVDEAHRTCAQVRVSPLKLELNTFPEKQPGCFDWQSHEPLGLKASSLSPYVALRCGVQCAKTPTAYTVAPKTDFNMFLFPPSRDINTLDRCCCCTCCTYPGYEKKKSKHESERIPGYRKEINESDNGMVITYENVTKNLWYLHANFLEIEVMNNPFIRGDMELCSGMLDFATVFHEVYFGEKIIRNEELEVDVPLFVEGHKNPVGKLTMSLELLQDSMAKGEEDSRLLWELSHANTQALEHISSSTRMVNKLLATGPADAHRANDAIKMTLARVLTASAINVLRLTVEHEDDVNPHRRERLAAFVEQLVLLFKPPDEIIEELEEAVQNLAPPMNPEQCRKVFIEVEPSEEKRLREFSGVIAFFIKEGLDAFAQRVLTMATCVVCSESKSFAFSVYSTLEQSVGTWVGAETSEGLADDPNTSFKRLAFTRALPGSEGVVSAVVKSKEEQDAKDGRNFFTGLCGENEMPMAPFYDERMILPAGAISFACALVAGGFGLYSAVLLSQVFLYADSQFFCDPGWQKWLPMLKGVCHGFNSSILDERVGKFLKGPIGMTSAALIFAVPQGLDSWKKTHTRWAMLQEFGWEPLWQPRQTVHKWICASGFLKRRSDVFHPWRTPGATPWTKDDIYCIRFASEHLLSLGAQLDKTAVRVKRAVLAARGARAISNPISLSQFVVEEVLISAIDIPLVCCEKQAVLAGVELARRIISGPPGVSLAAYGSACHMIITCLHELRKRNKYFYIKDVILMGASYESSDAGPWLKAREVVSGSMINAFKPDDAFLREQRLWIPGRKKMAGLHGVFIPGIENINLAAVVGRHDDYPYITPAALQYILAVRNA